MTSRIGLSLACLGLLGAGVGLAMRSKQARWDRKTLQLFEGLRHAVSSQEAKVVSFEGFDQLPEPVVKYLRLALKEGQPLIRSIRLKQLGRLRGLKKSLARWMPFQAAQFVSALRPGFVWDACIRASLLIHMRVRDAYVAGQGAARVSISGRHFETSLGVQGFYQPADAALAGVGQGPGTAASSG